MTIAAAGSDTTQDVMGQILTGSGEVNILAGPNQNPAVSVAADANCNTVTYGVGGNVAAPFGSGEGKRALRDAVAGTYPNAAATNSGVLKGCIDIARSSSRPNATDDGGTTTQYYGFALDAVTWASPSLNAPPSMTLQQLKDIYSCAPGANNWSYVGGTPGPIQRFVPQSGSGTRDFFRANVLGLGADPGFAAVGTPGTANYCPAAIAIEENKGNDLLLDTPNNAQYYQQAILPYSAGKFVVQATNRTNPTKDLRAGIRPGGLILPGTVVGATTPIYSVRWTGSGFLLNNSTVNGTAAQMRTLTDAQTAGSLSPLVVDTTVDSASAAFTSADVGSTLEGTCVAAGATVSAVNSATQIVISPGSLVTDAACTLKIGPAAVSEKNPQVCSNYPTCTTASSTNTDVLPGARLVFNAINPASPSFTDARDIVGFNNVSGGAKSPLCSGTYKFTIQSEGFLDLPAQTTVAGATGVTCRRVQ